MGALDDLLNQSQNTKSPSQNAAQEQKATASGGLDSLLQSNGGKIDFQQPTQPTPQPTQPVQQPQSNNWFQAAMDAVGRTLKEFLPQNSPVKQPITLPNVSQESVNKATQSSTPSTQPTFGQPVPSFVKVPNLIDTASAQLAITPQSLIQEGKSVKAGQALQQGVEQTFPGTIKTFSEFGVDPLSLKSNPKKALSDAWDTIKTTFQQEMPKINDYLKNYYNPIGFNGQPTSSKAVGKNLEAVAGAANIAFSPLSALFAAANDIPVLGSISRLVTLPFTFAGEGATAISNKLVDNLPISKEAKDQIKPGLGEIFALAAQIELGKATEVSAVKHAELVKKFGEQDAATIENTAQQLAKDKQQATVTPQQNITLNPSEARAQASATDISGTDAEKMLQQAADTAEAQGKDIQVNLNSDSGQFTATTPKGVKFSLDLVDKKQLVPLDESGNPPKPALDQTTGNPTTDTALKYLQDNKDQYLKDYQDRVLKEYGTTDFVSADDAKYPFPGYDGHLAPDYHPAAKEFANQYYDELLQKNKGTKNNTVLFTAGGTGVGKTSALRGAKYELKDFSIVYDTNLSAKSGIEKIQKALDAGYKVEVAYTHREAVNAFENGVIPRVKSRNRIVPISEHVARHITALDNIQQIAKHFEDKVNIAYIDNTGGIEDIKLSSFENLPKFNYNKEVLTNTLYEKTKQAINEGKLTQEQGNAIAGKDLSGSNASERPEKGTQSTEVTSKKPSYNSAQSRAIREQFTQSIDKLRQDASSQEDLIKGTNEAVAKAEALAKGDKTVLAGIRTALNKEMFGIVGDTGNYKKDFAILQEMKNDPSIGDYIKTLEGHIDRIDEALLKPSSELNPTVDNTKTVDTTGTGEVKTSKVSQGVLEKAVEAKLTRSLGDLPEYQRTDMKEQSRLAVELLAKDEAKATRIALGQEVPPAELLPESVFAAVEDKAIRDGNLTLIRELAKSSLSSEATVMGKRIAALAQRNPDSPVTAIKDIADERAKAYEKKTGKTANQAISDMKKQIKTELKKAAPKKEDWASFIKSIQC